MIIVCIFSLFTSSFQKENLRFSSGFKLSTLPFEIPIWSLREKRREHLSEQISGISPQLRLGRGPHTRVGIHLKNICVCVVLNYLRGARANHVAASGFDANLKRPPDLQYLRLLRILPANKFGGIMTRICKVACVSRINPQPRQCSRYERKQTHPRFFRLSTPTAL